MIRTVAAQRRNRRGPRASPALARSVGARAIVMLKNDKETLPLPRRSRRLAVFGPLADAAGRHARSLVGRRGKPTARSASWRVCARALADRRVLHAPGVAIDGEDADRHRGGARSVRDGRCHRAVLGRSRER